MPPRIDTAVQGPAIQHVQDVQPAQPQAPAPALGRSQSIGTTIARVLGALASGVQSGITSLVNLVRNVFTSHTQPHLPANNQTQERQAQRIHSANSDFADQILLSKAYLHDLSSTRDREFANLAPAFGLAARDLSGTYNPFKERVLQAVCASTTRVTAENLPALATRAAREMMFDIFFEKVFDTIPTRAFLEPSHFTPMHDQHMRSPDMQTVLNAGPDADVSALAERVCTDIRSQIDSLGNCNKASKEAIAEGMQLFQTLTGLSSEMAATLNTERVSSRFANTFRDYYDDPAINARTTQAFRQANQKAVTDFFTSKAQAYNSITTLRDTQGLPPELATQWQRLCLETELKLPTATFNLAHAASKAMNQAVNMEEFACVPMQESEFIQKIKTMYSIQSTVRMDDFNESQYHLEPLERNMLTRLIVQHTLASSPRQVSVELDMKTERSIRVQAQFKAALDKCLAEDNDRNDFSAAADADFRAHLAEVIGPGELFGMFAEVAHDRVHAE